MKRMLIFSTFALLLSSFSSVAQEKRGEPVDLEVAKVMNDGTITLKGLVGKISTSDKVVKGAPYSGTAITEHIQTLYDGNQIIRKNEAKRYRDSEGRTRNEQTLETIGKWTAGGEAQILTYIEDPVAGMSYHLNPQTRTATAYNKKIYTIALRIDSPKEGEQPLAVSGKKGVLKSVDVIKYGGPPPLHPSEEIGSGPMPRKIRGGVGEDGRKKTESLGKEVIEGLEVEHTRTSLTIPAGEIGNVQPIEIVDETWYSPELQLMVMTKSRDPRFGETTYRLTDIRRSEPDRSLFEVPNDYTIKKNTAPIPIKKRQPSSQ